MNTQIRILIPLLLAAALAFAPRAAAEDKPKVIRIAYPGVGVGNRPYVGGNSTAVVHLQGLLEEEFKKDGIQVSWTFLRGAGPAVNELYANGLADFSLLGDLPSIVGKAGGLSTRILAATGIRGNTYLAVPADSNLSSIKDLKGKRIGLFKGTNIQLAVAKLLKDNGLSEKDVRFLNMDNATIRAALVTKDIEGAFGGNDLLGLRDQGAVNIIYRSAGDPRYLRQASFVGTQAFISKYPDITKRIVKALVRAAKWISDNDKNPTVVYNLWTKSGVRFADYKEDQQGQSLKPLASPLLDPYFVTQYKSQIEQAKQFGLIKNTFSLESWIEPKFLNQALAELGLSNYWQPADPSGKLQAAPAAAASPASAGGSPLAQAAQ
jgi:sulfonate transport system substrate-binding protein